MCCGPRAGVEALLIERQVKQPVRDVEILVGVTVALRHDVDGVNASNKNMADRSPAKTQCSAVRGASGPLFLYQAIQNDITCMLPPDKCNKFRNV